MTIGIDDQRANGLEQHKMRLTRYNREDEARVKALHKAIKALAKEVERLGYQTDTRTIRRAITAMNTQKHELETSIIARFAQIADIDAELDGIYLWFRTVGVDAMADEYVEAVEEFAAAQYEAETGVNLVEYADAWGIDNPKLILSYETAQALNLI